MRHRRVAVAVSQQIDYESSCQGSRSRRDSSLHSRFSRSDPPPDTGRLPGDAPGSCILLPQALTKHTKIQRKWVVSGPLSFSIQAFYSSLQNCPGSLPPGQILTIQLSYFPADNPICHWSHVSFSRQSLICVVDGLGPDAAS